jgi:CBS domain containing-hemolysin-like protein
MSTSPYAIAPGYRLDEIIRLAETRLAAQLTVAIAADQRGMTFASFLATLEAAAIAALVSLPSSPVGRASLITIVIGFGFGTLIALWSAQPLKWSMPGYRPSDWLREISSADTLHEDRGAMAAHYDEMIQDNEDVLAANANVLRTSLTAVALTLVCSAIAAVAAHG